METTTREHTADEEEAGVSVEPAPPVKPPLQNVPSFHSDTASDGVSSSDYSSSSLVQSGEFVYLDGEGNEKTTSLKTKIALGSEGDVKPLMPPGSCFGLTVAKRKVFVSEKLCGGFSCLVALIIIISTFAGILSPKQHNTRKYYIAIDEVEWDYAPGEVNDCTGEPFAYPATNYVTQKKNRIGSTYTKALFREYTDSSFTTRKEVAAGWAHLGSLGPAIHAEVGDVVEVTVRNNARFPFSFEAQGVAANKANEGGNYMSKALRPSYWSFDDVLPPLSLGIRDCGTPSSFLARTLGTLSFGRVQPGVAHDSGSSVNAQDFCQNFQVKEAEARTISFYVDSEAGPGKNDPSSVMHFYSSHVGRGTMPERRTGFDGFGSDQNAGLLGPLIISKAGGAASDGKPKDVDRELVVVMGVQDENESPYLRKNIWDKIVKPQLGSVPAGRLPFGPAGKPAVLQALYAKAARTGDKLSYADAESLIAASLATSSDVGDVRGVSLKVWFDKTSYDPRFYDAHNGGTGTALKVMEDLWKETVDIGDPKFQESNAMHGVNGFLYCKQPGLEMNTGERVRWYMASVGNVDAVHTPHWHGNTVLAHGSRADQLNLLAGSVKTVDMTPENPGVWQLHCHVNDHKKAGMISFYDVKLPDGESAPSATCAGLSGSTRTYYMQAEPVEWSYYDQAAAAAGTDSCAGNIPFSAQFQSRLRRATESNGIDRIGVNFTKARYTLYTDDTFTTPIASAPSAGLLGPTIRAVVGDTIKVVARNALSHAVSVHPHGVQYQKGAEGAPYADGTSVADKQDDSIAPGEQHEYVWCVPESAGPGEKDGSSVVWLYHDHVNEINGTASGLVGPIIITALDQAKADGSAEPADVDNEHVLLFAAFNENAALDAEKNIAERLPLFPGNDATKTAEERERLTMYMRKYDASFKDAMRKRTINGYLQCSLPDLTWAVDAKVRLHLLAIGDEELHAPALAGHSFSQNAMRTSAVGLMASTMTTVDLVSSTAGSYLLRSASLSGIERGMAAVATVTAPPSPPPDDQRTHMYYIAADEVQWNFLPSGSNLCEGHVGDSDTSHAENLRGGAGGLADFGNVGFNGWADPANGVESEFSLYTDPHAAPHRIGTKYVMALFREYKDDHFDFLKSGIASRGNGPSEHLGIQGPVLRASRGDGIEVVVKNNLRFPMNFAVSGLTPKGGIADERPIAPGEARRIKYFVSSGPDDGDEDSIGFYYTSDYFAAAAAQAEHDRATASPPSPIGNFADYSSGLFGALLVAKDIAELHSDAAPKDVDREFILFMGVLDQNKSPYLDLNINQFSASPETTDKKHPDFKESNRKHAVNGYLYCNTPGLEVFYGREARWYVFALGADDAMVSPRWAGHSALVGGRRVSSVLVQPGMAATADITHENKGLWLVQDQTSGHAHAGAAALFEVREKVTVLCELTPWATC